MKKLLLAIFLFLQLPIFSQNKAVTFPNAEPGKCFAKVFIEDEYDKVEMTLLIYAGIETENILLDTLYFRLKEIVERAKKWRFLNTNQIQ